MALPASAPQRQLKHRRTIDVSVYARGDGLWEVDAVLCDTKTRAAQLADGPRPAGTPIHEMLLRLVVDERFNIVASGAETRWMPYPGQCDVHGDVYERLVGLNLLKNFRSALRERVGGVEGCTHITEMGQVLPTAVVQAFVGEVFRSGEGDGTGRPPFQIDGCHALRSDGDVVRQHYPRWYQPAIGSDSRDNAREAQPTPGRSG